MLRRPFPSEPSVAAMITAYDFTLEGQTTIRHIQVEVVAPEVKLYLKSRQSKRAQAAAACAQDHSVCRVTAEPYSASRVTKTGIRSRMAEPSARIQIRNSYVTSLTGTFMLFWNVIVKVLVSPGVTP